MWVRVALCLGVAVSVCSCIHGGGRFGDANAQHCDHVLAEHAEVVSDPDYKTESPNAREKYELRVAECYLEERKPEKALTFVSSWQDERTDKHIITARANAQLDKQAECRAAIERVAKKAQLSPMFYVDYQEFRNYAAQDWFVQLALVTWSRTETPSLQEFALQLMKRARDGLLPLEVAVADPQRPTGEWAVWVGAVRGGHMDRNVGQTSLLVEGVDVKNGLVDRSLVHVEHQRRFGSGVESTPTYSDTYQEAFVPNGRHFVVKFPGVSEQIVRMRTIVAFGRYSGRDPEQSWPVLSALAVVERRPQQRVDDGH